MKKNLEILEKIYELRYKSGKVHLFHSINKLVVKFGNIVSLDKIYVSKEYLSYLSEKLFKVELTKPTFSLISASTDCF